MARPSFTIPTPYQPVYPVTPTQPTPVYNNPPLYSPSAQTPASYYSKQSHTSLWITGGLTAAALGTLTWLLTRESPKPTKREATTQLISQKSDSPETMEKLAPEPVSLSQKFQDPAYCDQVAFNIATESFPAVLKAIQNAPDIPRDETLEAAINQSVAKYLHTACKVRLDMTQSTEAYSPNGIAMSDTRNTLETEGKFLSSIGLKGPVPQTDTQIQEWFTTYCHELRHMVHAATATSQVHVPRKSDDPFGSDEPTQDQYSKLIWNRGHATDGYSDILYSILKRTYPECREITFQDSYKKRNFTSEQLQNCWIATNKLWQQTDKPMPMLTEASENVRNFIPKWKKIFREGDPKVLESEMAHILDEMEAYRLCVKRAPGIAPQLVENDLYDTAVFLFLRDLMRLYYQERGIPKEQQHPYTRPEYAKANPLTLVP